MDSIEEMIGEIEAVLPSGYGYEVHSYKRHKDTSARCCWCVVRFVGNKEEVLENKSTDSPYWAYKEVLTYLKSL